jgi:hypothetical protein
MIKLAKTENDGNSFGHLFRISKPNCGKIYIRLAELHCDSANLRNQRSNIQLGKLLDKISLVHPVSLIYPLQEGRPQVIAAAAYQGKGSIKRNSTKACSPWKREEHLSVSEKVKIPYYFADGE